MNSLEERFTPIFNHLKELGASSENKYLITQDFNLIPKPFKPTRAIQRTLQTLPFFKNIFNKDITNLSLVIHKAETFANTCENIALVPKVEFVVTALKSLQNGKDPHLDLLQQINRLRNQIECSPHLSVEQKTSLLAELEKIQSYYDLSKNKEIPGLILSLRKECVRLEKKNSYHSTKKLFRIAQGPDKLNFLYVFMPHLLLFRLFDKRYDLKTELRKIDQCLERGADINAVSTHGLAYTPLIYAAYYGLPEIAAHLVLKGASPSIKERQGYNAYMMAKYYVNQYTRWKERLNKSTTSSEQETCDYYISTINRYQTIVDLLEPITDDLKMPS